MARKELELPRLKKREMPKKRWTQETRIVVCVEPDRWTLTYSDKVSYITTTVFLG
jgi:hypothetical protein